MKPDLIPIEVVYALADTQTVLRLDVPDGTTMAQAIEQSGLLDRFPEIDLDAHKVGVFGKIRAASEVLKPGDRVEIYRPLRADPKVVRKQRAARAKRASGA